MDYTIKTTDQQNSAQIVYSVSAISGLLKEHVEDNFFYVKIKGEVSGYKLASSGHVYFNLKDSDAVLNVVCWRSQAAQMQFNLEDGMEVICSGNLTIYQARSSYQLTMSKVEIAGTGALLALFEKRKQLLSEEGLFDKEHKKPLPYLPKTIALITSERGAVLHDMLHRIRDRFPLNVLLCDVAVQGKEAAGQITSALVALNKLDLEIDIIVIARGGGSIEDLLPFNEERLVRAIFDSKIPVISAVGHETDNTLADLVADLRAPTPTAAIELVLPLYSDLAKINRSFAESFSSVIQEILTDKKNDLEKNISSINQHFTHIFEILAYRCQLQKKLLPNAMKTFISSKRQSLINKAQLSIVSYKMQQRITDSLGRLSRLKEKLDQRMAALLEAAKLRMNTASFALKYYDYENIISRGFSVIYDSEGNLIQSVRAIRAGQKIKLRFVDGEVDLVIESAFVRSV